MSRKAIRVLACAIALLAVSVLTRVPLSGQSGAKNGEWRYYGGDAGSTKYSPLDQINKDNVKDLRIAWRWKAENFGTAAGLQLRSHAADGRWRALYDRRLAARRRRDRRRHGRNAVDVPPR